MTNSLFEDKIRVLLENHNDYLLPREDGYVVTNKEHSVYKTIVNELPSLLEKHLHYIKLDNIEHINVIGSTGDGLVGESFWIAFLDERVTKSTSNGLYMVLLFNKDLSKVYLTIASGTEDQGIRKIKATTKPRRRHFKSVIDSSLDYNDFEVGEENDIYLGDKERAKKFAASVCINKEYDTTSLNLDELLHDINRLNKLYYDYLFEVFMLENEEGTSNTERKKRKGISKDKYANLRYNQNKRNSVIGDAAEKFIYEREKNMLVNAGLDEYAEKVDWVASRIDGLGYDIESFFPDGTKKYIEVKGSSLSLDDFVFFISSTEKEVAEELKSSYVLSLVKGVGTDNIRVHEEIIDPVNQEYEYFQAQNYKVKRKYQ